MCTSGVPSEILLASNSVFLFNSVDYLLNTYHMLGIVVRAECTELNKTSCLLPWSFTSAGEGDKSNMQTSVTGS